MRFKINRASLWNERPCAEAMLVETKIHDSYTRKEWFVEIGSLTELAAFQQAQDAQLVIEFGKIPEITIYDDYLE